MRIWRRGCVHASFLLQIVRRLCMCVCLHWTRGFFVLKCGIRSDHGKSKVSQILLNSVLTFIKSIYDCPLLLRTSTCRMTFPKVHLPFGSFDRSISLNGPSHTKDRPVPVEFYFTNRNRLHYGDLVREQRKYMHFCLIMNMGLLKTWGLKWEKSVIDNAV